MKQAVLSLVMMVMTFGFFPKAFAAHIVNPQYNGYALDWCRDFEQGCGQPAADLYCKKRGYSQSESFQMRPAVNVQTMTVGQNAICNPTVHRCDSFNYIDCKETTKTFYAPTYNGYRLDWCKQFETGCGAPAAQAFCQKAGFPQLVNFQKQGGMTVQTMTVGSNAICNPQYHGCDSFTFVQCRK